MSKLMMLLVAGCLGLVALPGCSKEDKKPTMGDAEKAVDKTVDKADDAANKAADSMPKKE